MNNIKIQIEKRGKKSQGILNYGCCYKSEIQKTTNITIISPTELKWEFFVNGKSIIGDNDSFFDDCFKKIKTALLEKEYLINACGTCEYFKMTGLSKDWTNGEAGYCLFPKNKLKDENPITDIYKLCKNFRRKNGN